MKVAFKQARGFVLDQLIIQYSLQSSNFTTQSVTPGREAKWTAAPHTTAANFIRSYLSAPKSLPCISVLHRVITPEG